MFNKVMFSSAHDNWSTPKDVYDALDKEFHFKFDPCPLGGSGGLDVEWISPVFINPPYSDIKNWLKKGYQEYLTGKTCVFLIPSRSDTRFWHDYVMKATEIRFIKGRLTFGSDEYWAWVWEQEYLNGKPNKLYKKYGKKNCAPFPSCIVIFKPKD